MSSLRFAFLGLTFSGLVLSANAAETIYTPPKIPAGLSSTTFPSPRDDWYSGVQSKFDRFGNKPAEIVFDGDSITNRWDGGQGREIWKQRYAGIAADFGIEGDRVENLLWRLSKGQVDGINPKVVVIMIGTNNTYRDSAEKIADGIKAVVAEYERRCPSAHIILMAVFPRGETPNDGGRRKVAEINKIIAPLGNSPKVSFVDIGPKMIEADGTISREMMPDFVHPQAKGYQIWADAIQPIIDQYVHKKAS
ncbi:MAG TPA: GDSL-type esterase/lipase family protein [Rariglobus sp.]|jgi:lysophospholipase L1-like esterase|nr:GDSL-type esterase/lipase family protein [Rariglobus sp.]